MTRWLFLLFLLVLPLAVQATLTEQPSPVRIRQQWYLDRGRILDRVNEKVYFFALNDTKDDTGGIWTVVIAKPEDLLPSRSEDGPSFRFRSARLYLYIGDRVASVSQQVNNVVIIGVPRPHTKDIEILPIKVITEWDAP